MKYQFLPHYFKYIGILLFLIVAPISLLQEFLNGWNGNPFRTRTLEVSDIFFSKTFLLLRYLSILIYALAKDKVFDELMLKIRLESMYIVFFTTLIFVIIRVAIDKDWEMSATYLFEVQILLFLVLNKIRKNIALG